MSAPERTTQSLRVAGAALIALFGVWAGTRVYTARHLATAGHLAHLDGPGQVHAAGVSVPVGEASPPTNSDFDTEPAAGAVPSTKIPERLPAFSLSDRTGKSTSIEHWQGKSLILNFWATWCAPCRREIPLLKALSGQWAAHDIQVVGIAVDYPDKVAAYADELKIPYPLLIGEQDALDVAARLGVASPVFPFTVFTDRRGDLVTLYIGELHKPQADLILGVVQNLNDNHVQLTEARRTIAAGLDALAAAHPG